MNKINRTDLEDTVVVINELLNAKGGYHLYYANSGVKLVDKDSVDAIGTGCIPKRDLYNRMVAFIRGIQAK